MRTPTNNWLSALSGEPIPRPNLFDLANLMRESSTFYTPMDGFSALLGGPPTLSGNALAGYPSYLNTRANALINAFAQFQRHWIYVERRFKRFLTNLTMPPQQLEDGNKKQAGVRSCLNRHYYGDSSETANSMLIGSWGKATRVRPPRDIDILFLLPSEVYWQYENRAGNKQSQLLQEVKGVLSRTYSQTTMRGDGQVVVVPFDTMGVEIAPGFLCRDGSTILVCDTNSEGQYKTSTAGAEASSLAASDGTCNGNTRALTRMMKQWQRERNVPLKSFELERLAIEFMSGWPYRQNSLFWYDWMVRDFFVYLIGRANGYLFMPGTGEIITLGAEWLSRAWTAYQHAVQACDYEYNNYEVLGGQEWQQIFGSAIPQMLT